MKMIETLTCIKGTHMGPLLVLVSPCFREKVNVTCKIVSFLCNFLLKNAVVFFLGNQISKSRPFEKKGAILTYFLVTREKTQKFLQHISHLHTYIHVFCSPIDYFAFPIYHVWFLFGVIPGVDSFSRHFTSNQ